jgi:hypothetical protein
MIHQLTYLQPHPYCQKPLQTCFGLLRVLLPCISMDRLPTAFPDPPGVPDGTKMGSFPIHLRADWMNCSIKRSKEKWRSPRHLAVSRLQAGNYSN